MEENKKAIGIIVTVICIFSIFYLFNSNVSKRKAFDEIRASVYEEYRNNEDTKYWNINDNYEEKYIEINCHSYQEYMTKDYFDEKGHKLYYQLKDKNITGFEIRFVIYKNDRLFHRYIYR